MSSRSDGPRHWTSLEARAGGDQDRDDAVDQRVAEREIVEDALDAVVPLLARLRDVHAGRVVFQDTAEIAAPGDMLALGFEAKKSPSRDGLFGVCETARLV